MRVIHAVNVNDAYAAGLELIHRVGVPSDSRAGSVLVAPFPVMTVYERPDERVLLSPVRDANPFFHLFESIWMLSGANNASWLDQFVGDFSSRFAEPNTGGLMWGAYGHRWRNNWDMDQIETVVQRLRRDHTDRRVVIQMWDPSLDLVSPEIVETEALVWPTEPRDLPCNTQAYVRVRTEQLVDDVVVGAMAGLHNDDLFRKVLDLTICCRSNDIIWGAYGANAVHFSVLQEYLAARIGVGVGRMYQLSNNWHAYADVLAKMSVESDHPVPEHYPGTLPMFDSPDLIDQDVMRFMDAPHDAIYTNEWFHHTAAPMLWSHRVFRESGAIAALECCAMISAPDWRMAAESWLVRRAKR